MAVNISSFKKRERYLVSAPTICLCLIVGLSFLLHFFTRMFSGYIYAFLLVTFTVAYILSKKVAFKRGRYLVIIWTCAVIIMILSFLNSQRSNGAILDIIVFSCGLLLLFFCSYNENVYDGSVSLIKKLTILFAVGVFLQTFLPTVYRVVIMIFPSAYRAALVSNGSGFTLNTGYSAGYIIAGLMAVLSEVKTFRKIQLKRLVLPLFMFLALVLTGKRGPALFFIMTLVFVYLIPVKGIKKIQRYWRIFMIFFVAVIMLWAFRDVLLQLPLVGRMLNTIVGVIEGEDISSGRSRLYMWALNLFKNNPLFGIGWGRFRTTVVGNVTLVYELETHNIYLQLLAETGIIGFLVFTVLFLSFWNVTREAYSRCVQNSNQDEIVWRKLLFFSFSYQTYFLLYGLSGNPLYDPHFQIMYIFSCAIIVAYNGVKGSIKGSIVNFGDEQ